MVYTTIHINEAISLVLVRALLEFSINFQVTITFLGSKWPSILPSLQRKKLTKLRKIAFPTKQQTKMV